MSRLKRARPLGMLVLLALAALTTALPIFTISAAAQSALNAPVTPLGGSAITGGLLVGPDEQGNALLSLTLGGLRPGSSVDVNLNTGTCSQPSASVLRLFTLKATDGGEATANAPIYLPQGGPMRFVDLADGNHVVIVLGDGRPVGCAAVPAASGSTGNDLASALLAEGERQQVMQFNPNAALQKRIFADGFVPNSAEFSTTLEATTFAVQRAEHLRTGAVRAYFVRTGDWGNVRYAQRGVSTDALGQYMLGEAERHQAIRFNPNAALQKRIFADGFVPNSPEFAMPYGGVNYTAQRAEHLGTGRVRVYYAVTGQWNDVRFVQRGATVPPPNQPPAPPAVTISPTSGPFGTVVRVTGTGFGSFVGASLWGGPAGSEGVQLATGITDANGRVTFEVPVQGAAGMRWIFGIVAGQQHAESSVFTITG